MITILDWHAHAIQRECFFRHALAWRGLVYDSLLLLPFELATGFKQQSEKIPLCLTGEVVTVPVQVHASCSCLFRTLLLHVHLQVAPEVPLAVASKVAVRAD
jgi:hypothetical protein